VVPELHLAGIDHPGIRSTLTSGASMQADRATRGLIVTDAGGM
jgi:hypothetical protein